MLRRRHINADPQGSRLRSVARVAGGWLRDLAGVLEERLFWPVADLLRAAAEATRWPLERLAWIGEQRLLWPLSDRAARLGLTGRAAGGGALAALAAAVVVVGALSLEGGEAQPERAGVSAAATVTATVPTPPPPVPPTGRALRGAPPSFDTGGVSAGRSAGEGGEGSAAGTISSVPPADGDATAAAAADGAGAATSSRKPVPAGPVAMKVARRFSEAFVRYEIGERPGRAKTVFGETATPRLAAALSERQPRLPEGGEVPKARVLNLVPGPRRGRAYTVSASLLRVGLTTELRLEMKKRKGAWLVTDVRG